MLLVALLLQACNLLFHPPDSKPVAPTKMKLLWEIPYEFIGIGIDCTPMLLGDSLVIMGAGKELFAVEQTTGKIRWRAFISENVNIQTNVFKTDGVRVFATHVEDVRAYYIADGSLAWLTRLPEERGGLWDAAISYDNGRVYVGGDTKAYCLDAVDGSVRWTRQLQSRGSLGNTWAYGNKVIVGGGYGIDDSLGRLIGTVGKVYALDKTSGDTLWKTALSGDGGAVTCVDSSTVYAGGHFPYSISSFDAMDILTGKIKWTYLTPNQGWDYNNAIVVDNKVIAIAGPYHVCALDKNSGQLLWRTLVVNSASALVVHC